MEKTIQVPDSLGLEQIPSLAESAKPGGWTGVYLGLGLTTLATLILELSLTRIFSVIFYYHFAFMAISLALSGLGAGGVLSYLVSKNPQASSGPRLWAKLGWISLANSIGVTASVWYMLSRGSAVSGMTLLMVYFASALPFLLSGMVVSLAISKAVEHIDRAYFFDLAGASAGCLLLIPFLNLFGGPNTVIAAAVIFAISSAIWFHQAGARPLRAAAVFVALLLASLIVFNGESRIIDIHTAKGRPLPKEKFVAWNTFSRIGVSHSDVSWEADTYWTILIDGDAGTGISPFDFDKPLQPEVRKRLLYQGPGFPYVMRPGAKALVIGPGGGYDVARALANGSKDVTGVEINPIIINKVMKGQFATENHGLYTRPEVRAVVEDGRSFVRGSAEKYDVIQATLVDTWASTAAGAFALSENNLYTSDAFYDYLQHLTDNGVVAFTRWGFDPPRESLRLITLGMDALARLGEKDPARHFIAIREESKRIQGWGALDTVLISRKPFSNADVKAARDFLTESKMDQIYLPGDGPANPFGQLLTAENPQKFLDSYAYDVSTVGDDRPFFFYTVQPRDLWNYLSQANFANVDFKVNVAVPLLFQVVGVSLLATILMLILPRFVLGSRLPKQKGVMKFLLYFLCLGAGYILIQVALIQKFVLLMGSPTYALTVIVFSMLVASGLGSYFSRTILQDDDQKLMRVLLAIAGLVTLLAFLAGPLVAAAATWPLPVKMLITAVSIAPAAFLMGMPFPTGLRRLERTHSASVRWAWALNAAASVLGSAGAIFLAIYLGLRMTLLVGGMLYLSALVVIRATRGQLERAAQ
jgi:hypothetical protein